MGSRLDSLRECGTESHEISGGFLERAWAILHPAHATQGAYMHGADLHEGD